VERRYANATEQNIALATSASTHGQNLLRVQIFGPVDRVLAGESSLSNDPLPVDDIDEEIDDLLPGVRMTRSLYYAQNRYGPFGYAVGRGAGRDLCLYAWQRIASSSASAFGRQGTIQIRLRLCEAGASEEKLLSVMYGLSINAFFKSDVWNPYGKPPPPPDSLGRLGDEIRPVDYRGFARVLPSPAATRPGTATEPVRPAEPAPRAPLPTAPSSARVIVPPPPGSEASRNSESPPVPAAPAVPVVPPPPCPPGSGECD
jgi:hypothetical protein